ncbi:ETS homologous factor [Armadillidium nasatum]|uniref:ETS homologous factor n=1 Tax=Armadillidium nasatum TaxID=96803 RepID=A0A5N5SRA8_9CRUS|nr:ETS homologous factor [Armadillidium nasatum]
MRILFLIQVCNEFEDEPPPAEPPKKRGPGRPPKPESERKRRPKKTGRLWEFIRNLLLDPKTCPSLLRWEDAHAGIFRIVQSDAIANKWGMRKNNEKMNYEKLSRAMSCLYFLALDMYKSVIIFLTLAPAFNRCIPNTKSYLSAKYI